ncbi:kinase suppressor of Ras 2-like isoform X2 [Mizuhopecten yessoensis]|uniref:Kinase suppressor of Ras 2 n=1 Tax=Mizuhopecten yessoensis TaxID=6573 RepID=A0A210Q833_MIZYE|nr:kinase suppressor of Ras 2-like isoform X2 [Mizuhopecten yessoensis]OWF44894.1 Kinase suppressor of Ras 2 [Mizuhopecten yessoensis]
MSESSDTENDAVEKAIAMCRTAQGMIDFTAKHLDGLRTQCDPSEELTQKEIRNTESKLIKLFSKQLVAKDQLATDDVHDKLSEYPKTEQWLTVVGLEKDVIQGVLQREITLTSLLDMREDEVKNLLLRFDSKEEDHRKFNCALRNLKKWTEHLLVGDTGGDSDKDLSWTNYTQASSSPYSGSSPGYHSGRPSISSLPPENIQPVPIPSSPQSTPPSPVPTTHTDRTRYTPPPTPPLTGRSGGNSRMTGTPPTNRRHILIPDYPLTKSRSHESQLANRVTDIDGPKYSKKKPTNLIIGNDMLKIRRPSNEGSETGGGSRGPSGHTSPIPNSPIHPSRLKAIDYSKNTLAVPKSPKQHQLHGNHRFEKKSFTIFGSNCDVCSKVIYLNGKVCKDCKFKCHRDCAGKVSVNCAGDYPDSFWEGSPVQTRRDTEPYLDTYHGDGPGLKPNRSVPVLNSDSSSSCNSSTTSSPAPYINSPAGHIASPSPGPSPHRKGQQFHYPDTKPLKVDKATETNSSEPVKISVTTDTNTSDDSNKTLVDSNTSDKTLLDRVDSMDSQDDPLGHSWNRQNSLSVTLKDWIIPFEEVKLGDLIGTGSFGAVYRGLWHGDVAIKMLNIDSDMDTQAQMSEFKQEVAMLINKRHDNLILFAGACMKPPAIITSYCSGQTLFNYVRKEKFQMNRTIIIASQILQGMGFLHARGIFHKDLKSKNIFLENGKVVISDFGLFNISRLCHGNRKGEWLNISPGWLVYLCPEIIKRLYAGGNNKDLPFSEKSDVYAFGTVWYELICGEWPFKHYAPESIIWQVGHGLKPALVCIGASKDVKDVLMACWAYDRQERPDFSRLLKLMERLPKKRLDRSPSHPIHLSRSADPVFST